MQKPVIKHCTWKNHLTIRPVLFLQMARFEKREIGMIVPFIPTQLIKILTRIFPLLLTIRRKQYDSR